jgi:hypothetical protein
MAVSSAATALEAVSEADQTAAARRGAYNPTVMYRKTQQPPSEPLTRRDKRGLVVVGALVVAGLGGAGIWAAAHPGGYGRSHDGCVTVAAASSMGGALIHECGSGAVAMCRAAFTHSDQLSMLTRPQCRLAGLSPASTTGASPRG